LITFEPVPETNAAPAAVAAAAPPATPANGTNQPAGGRRGERGGGGGGPGLLDILVVGRQLAGSQRQNPVVRFARGQRMFRPFIL
jgi:hypothetical protein